METTLHNLDHSLFQKAKLAPFLLHPLAPTTGSLLLERLWQCLQCHCPSRRDSFAFGFFCVVLSCQRGHVADKLGERQGSVCRQERCHAIAMPLKGRAYVSARRFAVHASTLLAQGCLRLLSLPVWFYHSAILPASLRLRVLESTLPPRQQSYSELLTPASVGGACEAMHSSTLPCGRVVCAALTNESRLKPVCFWGQLYQLTRPGVANGVAAQKPAEERSRTMVGSMACALQKAVIPWSAQ